METRDFSVLKKYTFEDWEDGNKNKRLGGALLVSGSTGTMLFAIASIFLYKNRLREVETEAFTVIGSGEVRTMQIGIENLFPLLLLTIILIVVFLVLSCFGYRIFAKGKKIV